MVLNYNLPLSLLAEALTCTQLSETILQKVPFRQLCFAIIGVDANEADDQGVPFEGDEAEIVSSSAASAANIEDDPCRRKFNAYKLHQAGAFLGTRDSAAQQIKPKCGEAKEGRCQNKL